MSEGQEVGKATPQEVAALQQTQKGISELTVKLGSLEMQKRKTEDQILGLEGQAAELLKEIGQREGVPSGYDWHLGEDGVIRIMKPQGVEPPPPPPEEPPEALLEASPQEPEKTPKEE